MHRTFLIHSGFLPSERLEALLESLGAEATYKTARLGPEATDPGGTERPEMVVTDAPSVAEYWERKGVEVRMPSRLPEWMPRADTLASGGLESVEEVVTAVLAGDVQDVDGIGPSTEEDLKAALKQRDLL